MSAVVGRGIPAGPLGHPAWARPLPAAQPGIRSSARSRPSRRLRWTRRGLVLLAEVLVAATAFTVPQLADAAALRRTAESYRSVFSADLYATAIAERSRTDALAAAAGLAGTASSAQALRGALAGLVDTGRLDAALRAAAASGLLAAALPTTVQEAAVIADGDDQPSYAAARTARLADQASMYLRTVQFQADTSRFEAGNQAIRDAVGALQQSVSATSAARIAAAPDAPAEARTAVSAALSALSAPGGFTAVAVAAWAGQLRSLDAAQTQAAAAKAAQAAAAQVAAQAAAARSSRHAVSTARPRVVAHTAVAANPAPAVYTENVWTAVGSGGQWAIDACRGGVDITAWYGGIPTVAQDMSCGGHNLPTRAGALVRFTGARSGLYQVIGIVADHINAYTQTLAAVPRGYELLFQTCNTGAMDMRFVALQRVGN